MADINGTLLPDILFGTDEDDTINGLGGNDVLSGLGGNDTLDGGQGDDVLLGGEGDDLLIGGPGLATLLSLYNGGAGNDMMIASDLGLGEDFDGGDGIDTVSFIERDGGVTIELSVVSIPLIDTLRDVENVIGSEFADDLSGDDAGNRLEGRGGNDLLIGGGGDDILVGGAGADTIEGNLGNDVYRIHDALDDIAEQAGEGDDTLQAGVSYQLANGLSIETMTTIFQSGTAAIDLIGNDIAQSIFGNAGANLLDGGGGNDQLVGYEGNDILVGAAGSDVMRGDTGNDFYRVEDVIDIIFEAAGEGDDTIQASTSYWLGAGLSIETMTVVDQSTTDAINLSGNEIANSIFGNDGINALDGGGGNDLLTGYGGIDYFVFRTILGAGNVDVIADFVSGTDWIAIDNAVFVGLAEGNIGTEAFVVGAAAADADDRIVYDQATGRLYFDPDGTGAGTAVLFAIVNGAPPIAAGDFMII